LDWWDDVAPTEVVGMVTSMSPDKYRYKIFLNNDVSTMEAL
jgi:hypothetical protein